MVINGGATIDSSILKRPALIYKNGKGYNVYLPKKELKIKYITANWVYFKPVRAVIYDYYTKQSYAYVGNSISPQDLVDLYVIGIKAMSIDTFTDLFIRVKTSDKKLESPLSPNITLTKKTDITVIGNQDDLITIETFNDVTNISIKDDNQCPAIMLANDSGTTTDLSKYAEQYDQLRVLNFYEVDPIYVKEDGVVNITKPLDEIQKKIFTKL